MQIMADHVRPWLTEFYLASNVSAEVKNVCVKSGSQQKQRDPERSDVFLLLLPQRYLE